MRVTVCSRQRRYPVNLSQMRDLGTWLMSQVQTDRPDVEWSELAIILTDDAGILPVQRAVFDKHESTDVVSLRYDPVPPESGVSAEVVVNVDRAYAERHRAGGMDRELARYVAHGCQHLAGATDDTPAERAGMRRRENRWLRKADELGYVRGLVKAKGP